MIGREKTFTDAKIHNISPIFDKNSRTLILGSFPSEVSRDAVFYYAHPQNRFWKVLAAVYNLYPPQTNEEKIRLILNNNLALFDVIGQCEITVGSDASVKNVAVNDLSVITDVADIKRVFLNGKVAWRFFNRFYPGYAIESSYLPSTSAANAVWTLERLIEKWQIIKVDISFELIIVITAVTCLNEDVDISELTCRRDNERIFFRTRSGFEGRSRVDDDSFPTGVKSDIGFNFGAEFEFFGEFFVGKPFREVRSRLFRAFRVLRERRRREPRVLR